MSPLATVCHEHKVLVPVGGSCPGCSSSSSRRSARNVELGRNSAHWRRISKRRRRLAGDRCEECGGLEDPSDPGSKLTVDLVGGGDHSRARLEDTVCKCRRCHGHADGGRR